MYTIKIDPTLLENPDADIRYDLFEYLNNLYPDCLEDNGYDYIGEHPLMLVFVKAPKQLRESEYDSILKSIVSYNKYGDDFKDAISVFYNGQLIYPVAGQQDATKESPVIEIEYDLSEADVLAFMKFRLQKTRGIRNPITVRRSSYMIAFFLMALGTSNKTYLSLFFLALAILSFLIYPKIHHLLLRRRVKKTYRDPKTRVTLGTRILSITNDGLEETSGIGESKFTWDVISGIEETLTHAFISVLDSAMIILPKERFSSRAYNDFIAACREHLTQNVDEQHKKPGRNWVQTK